MSLRKENIFCLSNWQTLLINLRIVIKNMVVVFIRKNCILMVLSILLIGVCKNNFLPCPVHPALLHNFGCCYIILMRHKKKSR